jgi:DNA-binding beta-propeller fold protein YncE
MGARRFTSLTVAWLCLLAGCALLWGASAQATEVHVFQGSFGSEGSGPGQFKAPFGVAVNDATHDVYVVDRANNRVQEFNSTGSTVLGEFDGSVAPTGAFSEPTEIAIDNSANPLDPSKEDVYVLDRGHGVIDKFSAGGTYEGQLTGVGTPGGAFAAGETGTVAGVAVDPSGTVWVSTKYGPIYSFTDALANQYSSERNTIFGGAAEGLAVDAEDNLYFNTGGKVVKVNSSGETLSNPFGGDSNAYDVAVDPLGHEVYLDNLRTTIEAFDLNGAPLESDLSGTPRPSFGAGYLTFSKGIAVDPDDGTVYVTDLMRDRVLAFEGILLPSVTMDAVSEQTPRSLTLNGTVDPEGKPVTSCLFEYGTTSAYGQSAPCSPEAGALGSGSAAVAVSAHITGLVPGNIYHYRLAVENAAQVSSRTPDRTFTAGPIVDGEWAIDVASSSVTLQSSIDPNGADAHYYLQYGPTVAYGAYAPIAPPGLDLGSSAAPQVLSVHIQDLAPGALYHYRFVVLEDDETFEQSDVSFTTQPQRAASGLPDGRAWELVSPRNKNGALIEGFTQDDIQAASDGSGITYSATEPIGENRPVGKTAYSPILSTRGVGGWTSRDIGLPHPLASEEEIQDEGFEYQLFSPDLSVAAIQQRGAALTSLSPEAMEGNRFYLRDDASERFTPLLTPANVPSGAKLDGEASESDSSREFRVVLAGDTPDLKHLILRSGLALTSEALEDPSSREGFAGGERSNLYEWSAEGLKLVNILPNGNTSLGASIGGNVNGDGSALRAISSDGRWIAWTIGNFYRGKTDARLYVRDMVGEKTFQVGGAEPRFQTMSSDGSKAFFLEDGELYEFDTDLGTQTDLTGHHGGSESSAGVKEAVLGISEDGSSVYFVATGALAGGSTGGQDNLYLAHWDGSEWATRYITTLSSEDELDWHGGSDPISNDLTGMRARVSADGRYLAIMSSKSLTGYDNIDANSGQPDEEVYLFDAVSNRLTCVSCNPTGARPVGVFDNGENVLMDRNVGSSNSWAGHWLAGVIPGWDSAALELHYQPRDLLNNGRLFFSSPDALVAQDTNGLMDVYEFEPVGMGSCETTSTTFDEKRSGCVSLISSGTSSQESAFFDASETGDDVFFLTSSRLTAADYDTSVDVYDAHACSVAIPCVEVPVSPPPCTTSDSCKAAPSPQPEIFGPTPSATFNGIGNVIGSSSVSAVRPKLLTNAQKLAGALKLCHKKRSKRRRVVCEVQAHKRYPSKQARRSVTRATQRVKG